MGIEQMIMLVTLWCYKNDPIRIDYCRDEVVECVIDGEDKKWCQDDYLDIEYINN